MTLDHHPRPSPEAEELAQARVELDVARNRIDVLEESLAGAREAADVARAELANLLPELGRRTAELEEARRELAVKSDAIRHRDETIERLEADLAAAVENRAGILDGVEDPARDVVNLRRDLGVALKVWWRRERVLDDVDEAGD